MDSFPIACWCERLLSMCKTQFGKRLCCFGLQGSFRRGEATPASDIDIVLVLNALTVDDLTAYHALLAQMPQGERACGFVCGKQELSHWAPSELFTLYHDTKVLYGALAFCCPCFPQKTPLWL